MRKISACAAAFVMAVAPVSAHAEDVPLDTFLRDVKSALMTIKQDANSRALPPFTSATLNLSVTRKRDRGGKLKLFVLEFGKTRSSEVTSTVSIVLSPPPGSATNVAPAPLGETLAAAVIDAARAINDAKAGSPPLVASEVTASIKFGVTSDGNGAISFNLGPAEISGSGSQSSGGTQEIVIQYGK